MAPSRSEATTGLLERGALLAIDLAALAGNYRLLADRVAPAACAAVIKADAYGLGADRVGPALAIAGCQDFFVATVGEGVRLRGRLADARIYVLHGIEADNAAAFSRHNLIPVLNDRDQIARWRALDPRCPAVLHVDTGMNRLGLGPDDMDSGALAAIEVGWVMSHLACAEDFERPMNGQQLDRLNCFRARFPNARASMANSSTIFLDPRFHLDMVRAGIALYGGNPCPGRPNPMAQVVHLQGRIIHRRRVDRGMTVGYGASHEITAPGHLVTVSVGYADGYSRAFGNRGFASVGGREVPVVGRISMDLLTLDVTGVSPALTRPGSLVDLIGGTISLDRAAAAAGTISYELLTSLGPRSRKVYVTDGA